MEIVYQEVDYSNYCSSCKNADVDQAEEPCHSCLSEPINLYSCKPIAYKEDE